MVTPTGIAGVDGVDDVDDVDDVDEAFLALVCADDDLLLAEFGAIVGAGWPPTCSPEQPAAPAGRPGSPARGRRDRGEPALRAPRSRVGIDALGRERSPPGGSCHPGIRCRVGLGHRAAAQSSRQRSPRGRMPSRPQPVPRGLSPA